MKKYNIVIAAVFFLLTASTTTFAQGSLISVPSLRVEPDPVTTGRGFTGVAQADNSTTVFWNPAGLARQKGTQFGASRFKWLPGLDDDLSFNYITAQTQIDEISSIGGHITYLDLGSQSGRDNQGNKTGTFSSYELSIGVSYGRVAIPNTLSLGAGIRYTNSKLAPGGQDIQGIETQAGNALSFDIGARYTPGDYYLAGLETIPAIGVSITNFGGRIQYSDSGYKNALPSLFRLGAENKFILDADQINTLSVGVEFSKLLVSSDSTGAAPPFKSLFSSWGSYEYFDGQQTRTVGLGDQIMYGVGLEYWYNDLLALRTGYYNESPANGGRKFFTGGLSVKYSYVQINSSIAFQRSNTAIDNIIRLGLLIDF